MDVSLTQAYTKPSQTMHNKGKNARSHRCNEGEMGKNRSKLCTTNQNIARPYSSKEGEIAEEATRHQVETGRHSGHACTSGFPLRHSDTGSGRGGLSVLLRIRVGHLLLKLLGLRRGGSSGEREQRSQDSYASLFFCLPFDKRALFSLFGDHAPLNPRPPSGPHPSCSPSMETHAAAWLQRNFLVRFT